jgi:uncharacterized membrane protein YfcA
MINPPPLTLVNTLLLFSSSFIAGGINTVAGGGSFITFPMLIFTGMSPIAANATNNTGIWVGNIASIGPYFKDLNIQKRTMLLLCITSLIGGLLGSIALLYTSADVFKKLIPYLLLFATLVFTFGESLKKLFQKQIEKLSPKPPTLLNMIIFQLIIAIYGGFFGAGTGILILATLSFLELKSIHQIIAFKVFLSSCMNGIAIVPFFFAGLIVWHQASLIAVGASLGSYFTSHYARKLDSKLVRKIVIVTAFSMTGYFFIHG